MILREKVTLILAGTNVESYAEVVPLSTKESYEIGYSVATVNYRVILPALSPADTPSSSDQITWRGSTYELIGPPLKHTANGILHHLEVFITKGTG